MVDFQTVTIAGVRDIAEEEAATAYDALSEDLDELRAEIARIRREQAAFMRWVAEELVRLREGLG